MSRIADVDILGNRAPMDLNQQTGELPKPLMRKFALLGREVGTVAVEDLIAWTARVL